MAPSADWIRDIPSWALSEALFNPLIWALIFSDIASPAASSPALLIRKPEESFSSAFAEPVLLDRICRKVFNAGMLF
jgi:hypothetical protein